MHLFVEVRLHWERLGEPEDAWLEALHADPVGAAILLKTVTAPNLDGGNYANLQQGQLVFISNETEDYFECTTSLAPLAPVLMVSQNDVRIITAYGVFGNEP